MSSVGESSSNLRNTIILWPDKKHMATMIWLHDVRQNCSDTTEIFEKLPNDNVKWIFPNAPLRHVRCLGGDEAPAWFNIGKISEETNNKLEGLEESASRVMDLLMHEPADVKIGVGGYGIGATLAMFLATKHALGFLPRPLAAVVALSGWVPDWKNLKHTIKSSNGAASRVASLPIFINHGNYDKVVPYRLAELSVDSLKASGFQNIKFKTYNGFGHAGAPRQMLEIKAWLINCLQLEQKK